MSHPLQASSGSSDLANHAADRVNSNRLFIFDTGWQTAVKATSVREFCTTMAPGQDFYHSLMANEIYVHHGTEKLCLSCAMRRGIVHYEAKKLREAVVVPHSGSDASAIDVDTGALDQSPSSRQTPPTL